MTIMIRQVCFDESRPDHGTVKVYMNKTVGGTDYAVFDIPFTLFESAAHDLFFGIDAPHALADLENLVVVVANLWRKELAFRLGFTAQSLTEQLITLVNVEEEP